MHRRIQPLMARQKPMHQYSGVNDPDRHSLMLLALSEIESRVKVVMAPSSGSFMDEDSPHPLHKNVASDLVGFLLLVFFTLLSFFLFRFYAGFVGDWAPNTLPSAPPGGRRRQEGSEAETGHHARVQLRKGTRPTTGASVPVTMVEGVRLSERAHVSVVQTPSAGRSLSEMG
jgi:hypothetical protein